MSLINCPECGKKISDKAEKCIGCGCPISEILAELRKPLSEVEIHELNEMFTNYYFGINNYRVDYSRAVCYCKLSADKGNAYAKYFLGHCYNHGKGVEQNYCQAVKLYKEAISLGYILASFELGICYEKGNGVPQDFAKAYDLLLQALIVGEEESYAKNLINELDPQKEIPSFQTVDNLIKRCMDRFVKGNHNNAFAWFKNAANEFENVETPFNPTILDLQIGTEVIHKEFGSGTIASFDKYTFNVVFFDGVQRKFYTNVFHNYFRLLDESQLLKTLNNHINVNDDTIKKAIVCQTTHNRNSNLYNETGYCKVNDEVDTGDYMSEDSEPDDFDIPDDVGCDDIGETYDYYFNDDYDGGDDELL